MSTVDVTDDVGVGFQNHVADVDVKGKRVLLRVDLNVPTENGKVTDATRIERVAPTISEIAGKGGKTILLAHFGRPKGPDPKESLKPVAAAVAAWRRRGDLVAWSLAGATTFPLLALWRETTWGSVMS